jgi:hypothetical protein
LERDVYRSIAWQRCQEVFTTTLCSNQRGVVWLGTAWHGENTAFLIVALRVFGREVFNGQLPWFDEGCSKLLVQRKQAKLQWLQDPSEINRDNLNIRRETSRHFRNKEGISERQN